MAADASRSGRLSFLVAILLTAATGFFVWGAFAERSGHAETSQERAGEAANTKTTPPTTSTPAHNAETSQERAGEAGNPKTNPPTTSEPATQTTAKRLPGQEGSPAHEAAERARRDSTTSTVSAPPPSAPPPGVSSTSTAAASTPGNGSEPPAHNGETSQERAGEEGNPEGESGEAHAESEYRPFGVNLESTPLVLGAAFVSLALAALVALRRRRTILLGVVALAAGFTALEIVEVVHQADVDKSGLLALALIAGILHAAAALLAARLLVSTPRSAQPAPAG